jgi:hypothetical protein
MAIGQASTMTFSSSAALSWRAISSTLRWWSSRTAAITSWLTPSTAAQRTKGAKLRYNLFDAAVVEQQDSRDHVLGNALSGGPPHILRMKIDTETIRHGAGRYTGCGAVSRQEPANAD